MTNTPHTILNHTEINHKIMRIAYQIYESNANESEIILAGIAERGYEFALLLAETLEKISPLKITKCKVFIDKNTPQNEVKTSITSDYYENKSVVLIDDVLNSGATLIYGVKHFLNVPLKQFKTAVLVNRNHKKYPVKADFKGISLSTSLSEHVKVEFTPNNYKAYLL